ncbi:MAG TPA: hypothetical protein PLX06_10785 [Fimbriimonadaceae bacterium]|nr:hypothetical protein [Fimbriimonadaceae bacterium]
MKTLDRLTTSDLKRLYSTRQPVLLSLYLPLETSGRETAQGPIRLKNLLTETELKLAERGLSFHDIRRMLRPLQQSLEEPEFWKHPTPGLAIFVDPEETLAVRLPHPVNERVYVGPDYHVKPLLPLFSHDGLFYVLTLSENLVRIFEATRFSIREIDVEGVPRSLKEALRDDDPQSELQFRTGGASNFGSDKGAVFYGSGDEVGKERHKEEMRRFFEQVDRALVDWLIESPAPLLLGGVDFLLPIYRQASHYRKLLESQIMGNFDRTPIEEIHAKAWAAVENHFLHELEEAQERYGNHVGTGLTADQLPTMLEPAQEGRIDTLFVANAIVPPNGKHTVDPEEELLNRIAVATLERGGVVYALEPEEVPGGGPAAAILRF